MSDGQDPSEMLPREASLPVCPFCGIAFPGKTHCPDHDLALLAPAQTVSQDMEAVLEPAREVDAQLEAFDFRFGRGWIFLGAVMMIAAFPLPWLTTRTPDQAWTVSGLSFSSAHGAILWVVPAVALSLLWLMGARRSQRALHAVRFAVPMMALTAATAASYVAVGFVRGASMLAEQTGDVVETTPAVGAYLTALGLGLVVYGGTKLGQ